MQAKNLMSYWAESIFGANWHVGQHKTGCCGYGSMTPDTKQMRTVLRQRIAALANIDQIIA